jgi:hypothetical protein
VMEIARNVNDTERLRKVRSGDESDSAVTTRYLKDARIRISSGYGCWLLPQPGGTYLQAG